MDSLGKTPDGEVTRIGKYEILDVLGRGGMGVVYRGIDKQIGREVAIKTLTQGFLRDANMLARFYEEGRRTGRLNHPNIVTVYDLGDDNGTPYIVMECVEGEPLDRMIRSGMQPSLPERLRILVEVCSALGYAHRNNVIHRDVKPANIFVQPDGTAKLLDFGIARLEKRDQDNNLTQTGNLIGTVPYMAPERLRNEDVDGRSDIFAAGVVLFQLMAGQLPFSGTDNVLMQKIMNEPHPRLSSIRQDLPASLEPILDRALAKSLDDRYPAAEEMAADLTAVIAELQQDQVLELLPEAQRLMEAGEFPRARAVLHQLLKIDSKHVEARAMLGEIQRQLSLRQRENKIQQIRQQAEDALSNNRFDQSLTVLESGLDLDATNPELVNLRERARREKEKQNLIDEFLHQIDSARRKGYFKSAMAVAQKARKADKSNPSIIALRNVLTMEVEQAQRRAQAKSLLDSARAEIGSRRYNEAIELLKQVEEVDSTNTELPLLLGDANSGLEQGRRREVVTRLEEEVAQAAGYEKLQQAAQSIQEAMTSLPSESALFRLNSMVERQIKEYENRSLVDETVQACRNLHPREALELVRKARLRLPGEERLLSMEALFADRVRQQTVEDRRADYLARARENLEKGLYAEAVRILEFCHAEGIANGEIFSLLDFSRSEDLESRRQQQLRNNLDHAQALIGDSAYEEAISFLEDELQQTDDNAMRMLLDQASAGRDALRRHIDAELASAVKLVLAGKQKQALEFLKNEPSAVLCAERVQTALDTLEDERRQALFRTLGRAYAALECNLSVGEAMMQRAVTAAGHASLFAPMADAFSARARSAADRVIAEAIRNAKLLLRARTRVAARLALQTVSGMVDYASSRVRSDWQNMQRKASQTGLITRLCG